MGVYEAKVARTPDSVQLQSRPAFPELTVEASTG